MTPNPNAYTLTLSHSLRTRAQDERKVEIEEYIQGNGLIKHYDTIDWVIGSIFIPISVTLLGLSFTEPILGEESIIPTLGLFLLSLAIFLIWLFIDARLSFYCQQIFARLQEIEKKYGMSTHLRIELEDKTRALPKRLRRVRFWIREFGILILLTWILRLIFTLSPLPILGLLFVAFGLSALNYATSKQ